MEPLRPAVDRRVHGLAADGSTEIDKKSKAVLLGLLDEHAVVEGRKFPLHVAVQHLAVSLRDVAVNRQGKLKIPVL